jgi:uncharacterized membrane protein (GlpM family)
LVGLYAIRPLEWFTGGLACLFGLIAVLVVHQFRPVESLRYRSAVNRWQDEPRWALYRATGALWVHDLALGAGLGLALAALEWMLSAWTRKPRALTEQDPEPLYRSAISTALFILTHNFWLTAGTQMIFFLLLEHWARVEREPGTDAA